MGRLHGDAKLQPQKSNKVYRNRVAVFPVGGSENVEIDTREIVWKWKLSSCVCEEIKTGHEVSTLWRR